ncbi:MAG: T9SS type A sorting domain-containing protein [Chitinophagales bacterium]|nr:T9SS type A sorting domain-containing protein [Chitinophagales bacterium]
MTGLSTIAGSKSVKLKWTPDPTAVAYIIRGKEVSQSNLVSYSVPGGNNSNSVVSGLDPNTTYGWQIQKVCNTGNSAWSAPDTFTTLCLAPVNLQITNLSGNSATANWASVPGVAGYRIFGNTTGTAQVLSYDVAAPATSLMNNNLSPSTTYQWAIQTICDLDFRLSPLSKIDTFTTPVSKVGIEDDEILVTPNPSNGRFSLQSKGSEIEKIWISDMLGKLILEINDPLEGESFFIHEKGMYIISVKREETVYTKPIMVN